MVRPSLAFPMGSSLALLSWLALSTSLFLPQPWQVGVWSGTVIAVPFVLGLAYAVLLFQGVRDRTGGGFRSIEAVRRLFTSDAALAAGWLHYLAFDLFVGSWIVRAGLAAGVPRLLILPCLLLTFLGGPVGLVVFILLRVTLTDQLGIEG